MTDKLAIVALAGLALVEPAPAAQRLSVPPAPPPFQSPEPSLVGWSVERVSCGGVTPGFVRAPLPDQTLRYGTQPGRAPIDYAFRIDADGRPVGIARIDAGYVSDADDLSPALAAARFAPGQAQQACVLRYVATTTPVSAASREDAMRFTVFPSTSVPQAVWQRARPANTNCFEPVPPPLLRAYPDFKAMPGAAGQRQWSMVGFDLDARGRPVRAGVVAGSGFAPLDAASVKAVRASRFAGKERVGCLYPYYRNADTLAAPAAPEVESLKPAGATCPRDLAFARQPVLTFPEPFRRRSIEGWAVIAYDVAPWGEIGNVRVLAAEPAAEFGEWGRRVLTGASKPAGGQGYTGCVDKVVFRIGHAPKLAVESPPVVAY